MRLEIVHRDIWDIYIYETRRLLGYSKGGYCAFDRIENRLENFFWNPLLGYKNSLERFSIF